MKQQQQAPARSKKVKNVIDYNVEIPFERKPVPGFYDTSDEQMQEQPTLEFVNLSLQRLEGKRRDDVEEQQRRADAKKQQQREARDLPTQIQVANKAIDVGNLQRRTRISLPNPQVSDQELEEIGKLSNSALELSSGFASSSNGATDKLLSDYNQATPFVAAAASVRTPLRGPAHGDAILAEVKNLAALQQMDTPLKGGQNANVNSAIIGVTPSRVVGIVTPNPLAAALTPTLAASGGQSPASTTGSIFAGSATPVGNTPLRDEMQINNGVEFDRQMAAKHEVVFGLSSLPKPANEDYHINAQVPRVHVEEETFEEDAADVEARRRAEMQRRDQVLKQTRSQAVQRELPRPSIVNREDSMIIVDDDDHKIDPSLHQQVVHMLQQELISLLQYDAIIHPMNGKSVRPNARPLFEQFDHDLLEKARKMIDAEVSEVLDSIPSAEEFGRVWTRCMNETFFGQDGTPVSIHDKNQQNVLAALKHTFGQLKKQLDEEKSKSSKLENKANILTKGYQTRIDSIQQTVEKLIKQIEKDKLDWNCYSTLAEMEELAMKSRSAKLAEEVEMAQQRQSALQHLYASLLAEKQKNEELLKLK